MMVSDQTNPSPTRCNYYDPRVLPFQYAQEKGSTGLTGLAGLAAYLDLWQVAGLGRSVSRHLGVNEGRQGWTEAQVVTSLVLLNLAGGECVEDLRLLEKDEGLGRVLRLAETQGMGRRERGALLGRWRKERRRSVPSASAAFRFLNRFHDAAEEERREAHRAFIPAPTAGLLGLGRVNADLVGFVQSQARHQQATLDMDATLIETHKEQALYCYKKHQAYQPFTTYWAEAGWWCTRSSGTATCPAGHQQLRLLRESLERLPSGWSRCWSARTLPATSRSSCATAPRAKTNASG